MSRGGDMIGRPVSEEEVSSSLGFSMERVESSGEVPAMRRTSLSIFFNSLFEAL